MRIHVCLVSDQTLANLIPVLMERPDRVILVSTPAMEGRAGHLLGRIQSSGIKSDAVSDAPDAGMPEIRRYASALAESLVEAFPAAEITFNATGGTKLMTLGFVPAFESIRARIIYTDTAHRRIEEIGADANGIQPMADVLDVPHYLAAQGMRFDRADSDDDNQLRRILAREKLTLFLGENIGALQGIVKAINRIIYNLIDKNPVPREGIAFPLDFAFRQVPYGAGKRLLRQCVDFGLIEWDGALSGRFLDLDATRYLNGIWLEEYAWLATRTCNPFDLRLGVHRLGASNNELNEFDLLAVHCNQLLFVECKTANYQAQVGQANQTAYKVDSLSRQARGLFGETWLLSAITPPSELEDRCRDARIRLIGPNELPVLGTLIQTWMSGP